MSQISNLFAAVAVMVLCIVFGCKENEEVIGSDKCIFMEHHIGTQGEIIEGNYKEGPMYDSPSYSYYNETGILSGYIDFNINQSLKVVLGNGISRSGAAGSGVSTMLMGIYELPYENNNFEIKDIESDGTIHLVYNDSTIVLKSNEEWINKSSAIDTQNNAGEIAKANLITTDRIVNYGIIEKSNIRQ